MKPTIACSYINPDLDGVACSVGMAELLRADAVVVGTPSQEAAWMCDRFGIPMPPEGRERLADADVILVDASDPGDLDASFPIASVVEIIDHRLVHRAADFPNATRVQIEQVGSCATLVAERLKQNGATPSRDAARLLTGAIVSNTVDFKSPGTTDRDRAMFEWLAPVADLPEGFAREMFLAKSDLSGDKLCQALVGDWIVKEFGGTRFMVFQLEAADVADVVAARKDEILAVMRPIATAERADAAFLNAIDILNGTDTWLALDEATIALLESVFDRRFDGDVSTVDRIVMRKQIVPKLKEFLESRASA